MSNDHAGADELSRAKQLLLERMLRERRLNVPGTTDEIVRGHADSAPLSFAQEQLWFLEQMDPDRSLYNVAAAVRISGALDVAALTRALAAVVRRHESLRTAVHSHDGDAVQRIAPRADLPVAVTDLSALGVDTIDAAVAALLDADTARPFDLDRAPLARARIVRLASDEHVFHLVVHHLVCDGWSLGLLTDDLRRAYVDELSGAATPAAPPAIRYADYATWQRRRRGTERADIDAELEFWRAELDGVPTLLELPTDRPRPAAQSFRGAHCTARWDAGERTLVRDLSRAAGTSDHMTLLAAFGVVLARYGGGSDLLVGSPVAGRTRPELQDVVGLFVNTVPIRLRADDTLTFTQLLAATRTTTLDAFDHQDVPFDRIVDALAPERNLSHSALVQVLFELRSATPSAGPAWPGLTLSPYGTEPLGRTAKFDLSLTMADAGDGYELSVEYATDLFDAATVEQFLRHFRHTVTELVRRPDVAIGSVPVVPAAESERLLHAVNPDRSTPVDAPSLPAAFLGWAGRSPDSVAVVHGAHQLTYASLRRRAETVAAVLRGHHVGPEVRVAVCLPKGIDLLVALLGVHLAGGAYIPVDPSYPQDRVEFMLADSRAAVLLTDRATDAAAGPDTVVVLVDDLPGDLDGLAGTAWSPPAPDTLAYVIYTSGSTGTPRGVQITHRNLAAALASWCEEYVLRTGDRHLQLASPAFDVFTGDLTRALGSGAALVLGDRDLLLDPPSLADLLVEQDITCAEFVPVVLRHVAAELDRRGTRLTALRMLVAGSDAWHVDDHLRALRVGGAGTRVVNSYGLTEATVDSTYFEGDVSGGGAAPVPIGRPMRHARAYVLDAAGRPAPTGVPGELHLGGPGIGRGYLGRPGRTAAVFVPDPFATTPGARLYRTGDRARWRRTGDLEFLGRLDHQVKLRGFRIELGEVESVLAADPDVQAVVAVVRADAAGTDRLVAYVVAVPGRDRDDLAGALRTLAATRLPEYMVPAAVTLLPALPLTPNGKLDRSALPELVVDGASGGGVEPATPAEHTLARIWADVLGRDDVGVEDNFFTLGGDSIVSLQLVARSRAAGLVLTPRQVFEHQTVRGLASVATVSAERRDSPEQGEVVGPVPLTAIQRQFFGLGLPAPHHYNLSLLLASTDRVRPAALARAVRAVLQHHDALRLRFEAVAGTAEIRQWQCGVDALPDDDPDLVDLIDLAGLPEDAQTRLVGSVSAAAQTSLRLDRGCLLRVVLFDCGADRPARLLVVAHHLAVDGVSWRVLLEDLATAFGQACAGEPVRLPAKTTSFRDWARRAEVEAGSAQTLAEVGHWTQVADAITALTTDHPVAVDERVAVNTVANVDSVHVRLPAELTSALLSQVPQAYRTRIDDALLSALAQALVPLVGSRSVVVESERHGRSGIADDLDVSRTVGWFTSAHPVRLDLGPADDQGALLRRVKEQLRAVPRDGVGWGLLRRTNRSDAVAATIRDAPQPDIAFNYLGRFDTSLSGASSWAPAQDDAGANHDPREPREYVLEITALVSRGCLELVWSYSRALHRRDTIEAAADRMRTALAQIVDHCAAVRAGGRTPSDFPLAGLAQPDLDRILASGPVEDVYRLTPMQEGMLFHTVAEPDAGTYHEQFACQLQGDFDVPAFQAAWADVLARHSALRVSFHWVGLDEPVQAVHSSVEPEWSLVDRRGEPAPDQWWTQFLAADRRRGFDLERGPLLRFVLVRLRDDLVQFLFSHHHLLLDGWSFRQVLDEVFAAYTGRLRGVPVQPAPVRQYRDFVASVRAPDDAGPQHRFWSTMLTGRPATGPFGQRSTGASAVARTVLTREQTDRLSAFARAHQLTLNTVVQAAWSVVVGAVTGTRDVVHGMTLSGRPAELAGVEDIVGLFINTVPVRLRLPDSGSVADWLRTVQSLLLDVQRHQATPLVTINQLAGATPDHPLFDTLVVFENYPLTSTAADREQIDLQIRRPGTTARTNYPATLVVAPDDQLPIELQHDVGAVAPGEADELLRRFCATLLEFVEHADEPIDTIVGSTDRNEVLLLGTGARPVAVDRPVVHDVFAHHARTRPHAPALVGDAATLTYGELADRADRLARRLVDHGVRRGDRVALLLRRGPVASVAALAVLRAGAAYVPLDPDNPDDRMRTILAQTAASAVVVDAGRRAQAAAFAGATVLIDPDPGGTDVGPVRPWTPVDVGPDDLAYVMFTSGSTGTPKGVAVPHRAVVALALDSAFAGPSHDAVLLHSTYAFDAGTYELWAPLLTGRRAVVAPDGVLTGPELARLVGTHDVTSCWLTAGLFAALAEDPTAFAGLSEVWTGGDVVSAEAVRRVRAVCPTLVVVDGYGPTETTTFATRHVLAPGAPVPDPVPIGRPLDGMSSRVLDGRLVAVPSGVEGELFLGGTGLAWGYLGDPALTAQRFVPDPYGPPGARMYRTGDLARWNAGPDLEFVGRRDDQVKVRGFRIEPGDVESTLRTADGVRDAVVTTSADAAGDRVLIAHVLGRVDTDRLRQHCARHLPGYLVPSEFRRIDRVPLTPNGKVDRAALAAGARVPEPAASSPDPAGPQSPAQAIVLGLVEQAVGRTGLGVDDDFFGAGGHSLTALRLVGRLRDVFGCEVPLAELYRRPTAAGLAAAVAAPVRPDWPTTVVPLRAAAGTSPLVCLHPKNGTVFAYSALARTLGGARAVLGIQSPAVSGGAAQSDVATMARGYVQDLVRVQPTGPYHLCGYSLGGMVAYEMAGLLRDAGAEVATLVLLDCAPRLSGPPFPDLATLDAMDDVEFLVSEFADHVTLDPTSLRPLAPAERLRSVAAALAATGRRTDHMDLQTMARYVQIARAHTRAAITYDPRPYDGSALLLRCADPASTAGADPSDGWAALVRGGLEVAVVPGVHTTMLDEPNLTVVLDHLRARLPHDRRDGAR